MDSTLITILVLGLVAGIASLVLLVRAFQVSVWWGVACLLIPFAQTFFGLCHWSRAKYSFLVMHLCVIAIVVMIVRGGIPMTNEDLTTALISLQDVPELTAQIQEQRNHIEQLDGQFQKTGQDLAVQFADLNKKRAALKPDDTAAVQQFNAEAAAYDTQNKAHKAMQNDLEAARLELQKLLDERTRRASSQRGPKKT